MSLDWNSMAHCTLTSSDPTDHSLLWTSSSNFALQWAKEQCPEHSSSDEHYQYPNRLDFPDLQVSISDKPSPPQLPTSPSSDGPVEDKCKKRREQNRNAQRAFRERKEKYVKDLLKHMDEMNKNHAQLLKSYESIQQEALQLRDQVQSLKRQLEFWNKAQIVVVKFPEHAVAGAAVDALQGLLAGPQHTQRPLDSLLTHEVAGASSS
ncbi:hypothetical protein BDV12DRAFT_204246 [Aspergillus spectabilis]